MFRSVELPDNVPGKMLLHSMPGRFEPIELVWQQVRFDRVGAIYCLTEAFELRMKSTAYADALATGTVPCAVVPFEIREGSVPPDRESFWQLANDIAGQLRSGEKVLIHCAGGVGRTAMLAATVLMAMGVPLDEAESVVSRAGSIVETATQIEMLAWCATRATVG